MTLSCFYCTDHKFFIFWKLFSLALKDKQIKKFTRQWEFPLTMASRMTSRRVEFSSPANILVPKLFMFAKIFRFCIFSTSFFSVWVIEAYKKYKIKRKFTFFCKYQIYFISWVENLRIFNCAAHSWKFWCFNTLDEIYLVFTSKK